MSHKNTIIIGAGMAGIMAARTLQDAGWPVRILEARTRVGGRTHTDNSLGSSVDLGGSWIHGPYGNPLTPLAEKFNVTTGYTDFINAAGNAVLAFDADGAPLDMAEYTQGLQLAKGIAAHAYGSALYQLPDDPACRSLKDLYDHGLPVPAGLTLAQQKGYYYASVVRVQYGDAADLDEVDWRLGGDYIMLPGGDLLVHGGGFNAITNQLAEGLTIDTETIVNQISYGANGVTLATNRGEMHCDQLIITVPLGVLKSGQIQFSPALPADKADAIERIGFGNYEKLVLRFPQFFWPQDIQRFNYLTDQEPELFTSWLNTGHYTGEPIIVAYHAGSRAKHVNTLSDQELLDQALSALKLLFGDNVAGEIPEPVSYLRTGWEHDPHALGSYSFDKVGQQAGDRAALASAVDQQLFFAGEATHPHYYATVHGAYESGVRAAQEVMGTLCHPVE